MNQLFDLAKRVDEAFSAAGIDYRVIGGLATYLYVEDREPDAGRLTKDIDIVVRREDLSRISEAVRSVGLEYRHTAGIEMLVDKDEPSARRAVHMVFTGERVRPEYSAPVPPLGQPHVLQGVRLISLEDLAKMKLTSFRLKDQVHIQDLDKAGLITAEVESALPEDLRARLARVRAQD